MILDSPVLSNLVVYYNNTYTIQVLACFYGNKKDIAVFVRHPFFWINLYDHLPKLYSQENGNCKPLIDH